MVVLDIGEDGGLDVEPLTSEPGAPGDQSGTLLLTALDVAENFIELLLVDLRSLLHSASERISDDSLQSPFLGLLQVLVVHVLVHEGPRPCAATLALVEEEGEVRQLHGLIHIGPVTDDEGRLSPELQRHLLQIALSSSDHDFLPNLSRSGEGNLIHIHVAREGGSRGLSITRDNVQHARRDAGLQSESSCQKG
ncbi:hypothetical protein Mapa_013083 [Marchantia paleacea]|nr:hypothetical protein Mapa_013083 [Marchantia paleacea]